MSFEELNDPRSSEVGNNQIQLTELATYEERTPGLRCQLALCSAPPAFTPQSGLFIGQKWKIGHYDWSNRLLVKPMLSLFKLPVKSLLE